MSTIGVDTVVPGRPEDGAPPGLVALEAANDRKRELLAQAADVAAGALDGGPELPAGCGRADLPALLQRYYWSEPAAEVLGRAPGDLAALALRHLRVAAVRAQGAATVVVERLDDGRGLLLTVTDDMPFLVDSVTAEVVRQGAGLQHVVHPVVVVRRDVSGALRAFCDSQGTDAAACGPDALAESWMAVVLDGPLDEEATADLVAGLRTALADVRAVDEDGPRIAARALALATRLEEIGTVDTADPADDPAEVAALLRWLADGNLVLLGAREVEVGERVRAVPGTGLGVLRSDTAAGLPEAAGALGSTLVTVTKADVRSTVHRRAWLDLVAVTLPGRGGGPARQHRFVGLFPTVAAAAGVRDVPLVRRRVEEVVAGSGVPADSHTGKELVGVLETLPRDELFQATTGELLPVAMAVVYLQERRRTRLFLRRDPYGRFWSALVYVPRDRYTTEVRTRMQRSLLSRLGGREIEFTARSTESVLTRLHFVVRVPVGRGGAPALPEVDAEALQQELAAVARSWTDDLTEALAASHGDGAEQVLARVADAFPAAYQDDFPATTAVEDLARLDALQPGELGLRLRRPRGAGAAEPRLTVYRVGERLLLSDVLPVLQHMGVDVIDERPYEIDRIGAPPAWIYDFGLTIPPAELPGGELPFPGSLPERFTEAVAAVWRGDAEDDGLGALVLLAGLNWRQVTVVRAYVQWLRQAGLPFGQHYVETTLAAHPDVVARLVALFETRFSPDRESGRERRQADLAASLREAIGRVDSLDADRVLSSLLAAVTATQRTTSYAGGPLAIKLDPHGVPDLPEPRPAREVFVSSPRVMGVHLRFGAVARG
ncbi:MAG TPA: NAD-glutamate dehydrogenase domain-containing protein, partial [Geodermatophilus sp.]|nr:NAD-glutamate dehydrogenase domain-containing protein [Geodermatophilus sp.]